MRDPSCLIFTATLGLCLVPTGHTTEESHAVDRIADETSLIQIRQQKMTTRTAMGKAECGYLIGDVAGDPDTFYNNNRKYHSRGAEFSRSIIDVMAEHPGEDGCCYFNASANFMAPIEAEEPDYVHLAGSSILRQRAPEYAGLNTGPRVTFHIEGETPTSHIDSPDYAYDDLYGYSLGYLQGQGLDTSKITNATAWEALAAESCAKIQQKYNFTKDELILNDLLDANMPIYAMSYCSAGLELDETMKVPYVTEKSEYHSAQDCKQMTHREFARHHYLKCVLSNTNAAASMAYLHSRACLLEGNRIGHFQECPFAPEGMQGNGQNFQDSTRSKRAATTDIRRRRSDTLGNLWDCVDAYASGLEDIRRGLALFLRVHHTSLSTSQRNITFGVGPSSAGTSSVSRALCEMGFDVAHNLQLGGEDYFQWVKRHQCSEPPWTREGKCLNRLRAIDYTSIPEHIEVAMDQPIASSFIDLFQAFPNARWLLGTRPAQDWAKAQLTDHHGLFVWGASPSFMEMPCHASVASFAFETDELARMMTLHDDLVRCAVPPEKLFEFSVFNNTEGLAHDLGKVMQMSNPPSKNSPFPHVTAESLTDNSPGSTWAGRCQQNNLSFFSKPFFEKYMSC